jgi:hypothetical protein
LTSPFEQPCLTNEPDLFGATGYCHQATKAIELILCQLHDAVSGICDPTKAGRSVHLAIIHLRFSNIWDFPLHYERHFVDWDAMPLFLMRGVSRFPLLFWNETAGEQVEWVGKLSPADAGGEGNGRG